MSLELLRQTTRPAHRMLEQRLSERLETISIEDYRALLTRFFGFFRPLEAQLTLLTGSGGAFFDFTPRLRAPLLVKDLVFLGLTEAAVAALPVCHPLPALSSPADAFGALYVSEGSALGGQVIARRLQARLGTRITHQNGLAFFYGDGPGVAARWNAFLQALARQPAETSVPAAQTALRTFEALARWLFPEIPLQQGGINALR